MIVCARARARAHVIYLSGGNELRSSCPAGQQVALDAAWACAGGIDRLQQEQARTQHIWQHGAGRGHTPSLPAGFRLYC